MFSVAFFVSGGQIQVDEAESLPDGQTIRVPFSVKPWSDTVKCGSWLEGGTGFFVQKQSKQGLVALHFLKFNLFAGEWRRVPVTWAQDGNLAKTSGQSGACASRLSFHAGARGRHDY
ncbi:hypothetical protein [Pararhizobium sp. A13]|uniref:hypothetical protein n=1 Tax=Pararhizobium sp. A13 TaxID=3133975 RepID=UPI00324B2E88